MAIGLFVALEGIDGAGTTTQAKALGSALRERGVPCLVTREPSDGPIGTYIRTVLAGGATATPATMALLFAADRLDHVDRVIQPALERGEVVISDRYLLSSLAYQGTELGDPAWVAALNSRALEPDITFLLDIPVEVAARRRSSRDAAAERYERDGFLEGVAQTYRDLAAVAPSVTILDGGLPPGGLTGIMLTRIFDHLA